MARRGRTSASQWWQAGVRWYWEAECVIYVCCCLCCAVIHCMTKQCDSGCNCVSLCPLANALLPPLHWRTQAISTAHIDSSSAVLGCSSCLLSQR